MTPDEMYGEVRAQVQCYCGMGNDPIHGHLHEPPACPRSPVPQGPRHGITSYATAAGWVWHCYCGAESKGSGAQSQGHAKAHGERHIRAALRAERAK